MSVAVWRSYRAACIPHLTGCRQCGAAISDRRAYCSRACKIAFECQHFWGTAQAEAIRRACPNGERSRRHPETGHWVIAPPMCAKCGKECASIQTLGWRAARREAEVNHIIPLNGDREHFSCAHHQANLEVLCHACHVEVSKQQRREGLIGRPKLGPLLSHVQEAR